MSQPTCKVKSYSEVCLVSLYLDLSIAAQTFATSSLMSSPLTSVTIEYLEQDVACFHERVFIKNYVPFTDQLQPICFTCNGLQTNLLVKQSVKVYAMQSNESCVKSGVLKSMVLYSQGLPTVCDRLKALLWAMALVTLL